jgi:hypothetical protein
VEVDAGWSAPGRTPFERRARASWMLGGLHHGGHCLKGEMSACEVDAGWSVPWRTAARTTARVASRLRKQLTLDEMADRSRIADLRRTVCTVTNSSKASCSTSSGSRSTRRQTSYISSPASEVVGQLATLKRPNTVEVGDRSVTQIPVASMRSNTPIFT